MIDELYLQVESIVYKSEAFRKFIINTHPLWQVVCETIAWGTPISLAIFFRPRWLVPLLGGFCFMFFYLLVETSPACLPGICRGYNTNDNAIGTCLMLPFGMFYSVAVVLVVWSIAEAIRHRKSKRRE